MKILVWACKKIIGNEVDTYGLVEKSWKTDANNNNNVFGFSMPHFVIRICYARPDYAIYTNKPVRTMRAIIPA